MAREAVGIARSEQVRRRRHDLRTQLLQRRDVVQDPEAAPVGPHHQVVEVFLHLDPVHRRHRHVVHERLPVVPVVERDVEDVLGAEIEEPGPHRILVDVARVAERTVRDALDDLLEALAVVVGAVHVRLEVALLVMLDRQVGLAGLVGRRVNAAHDAVRRQIRDVVGHVAPGPAPVPRDVHEPVVGPGPHHVRVEGRLGEGVDHAAELDPDVVRRKPA